MLVNLVHLSLTTNYLKGTVSKNLTLLTALQYLNINHNQLTGVSP